MKTYVTYELTLSDQPTVMDPNGALQNGVFVAAVVKLQTRTVMAAKGLKVRTGPGTKFTQSHSIYDGERVTLVGIYMPRAQPGGTQMLGHASVLVGGVEIRLGNDIRAMSEILKLAGETVAITGKLDLRKSGQIDPKKLEKPILTDLSTPSRR